MNWNVDWSGIRKIVVVNCFIGVGLGLAGVYDLASKLTFQSEVVRIGIGDPRTVPLIMTTIVQTLVMTMVLAILGFALVLRGRRVDAQ